jgi:hypothetical protein
MSCAELRHGYTPLTRDHAIQLAFAEFHRRGISVSPRWQVKAFQDVHIAELHPDVPLYVVEFYDPALSSAHPLYIVKFHRYSWELDDFMKIDLPTHGTPLHRSNKALQPTATRFMSTFL